MILLAIIVLYATFLLFGWLAARRSGEETIDDLLLAGRAMPLWLATMTMTATWVDGGYLLGTAEGVYRSSLSSGLQGGICFGISLILGGLFFARRMREQGFTTLIDPFEVRFGKGWAVVLFIPAVLAEIFWSAELLVAIGSTLGVLLDYPLVTGILLSAAVVVAYTMAGGMWSVAYTDALQLALVVIGLLVALPFIADAVGGLMPALSGYLTLRKEPSLLPVGGAPGELARVAGWWDVSLMLILGGIPWNCYFQRVLACQTPRRAQWHSILAGVATMALTLPPLLIGVAAFGHRWPAPLIGQLETSPSLTLPLALRHLAPPLVTLLGAGAIIGAVTSSFSSSILSAASMIGWNGVHRLLLPGLPVRWLRRLVRGLILILGVLATLLALRVQSVQALWFFTSDLVFVLLFPQLLWALFDPRANRTGSMVAFGISLALRIGGGEPLFGIPPTIDYPGIFSTLIGTDPAIWRDPETGANLFPFKVLAAVTGIILLPLVSRLTSRYDPPSLLAIPPKEAGQ